MPLTRFPLKRGTAAPVMLDYRDAEGERSVRRVMPLAILQDNVRRASNGTYLQGKCMVVKAVRTFRFDRIDSLSDPETGEVFAPGEWLAEQQLGAKQPFAWEDDPPETEEPRPTETAATPAPARAPRRWRLILAMLAWGYVVGRLRLIHLALRYFQVRAGLWL